MDLAFSQILNNTLVSRSSNKMLSEMTEQAGNKISVRNLQRYRKGEVVPSFEFAKVICEALKLNMSDEEIFRSLELDKERQRIIKSSDAILKLNMSINMDGTGYTADEVKMHFGRIALERYPDNKDAKELLVKDMIVNLIREGNV